jgi:predicted metal-dependent peptidase
MRFLNEPATPQFDKEYNQAVVSLILKETFYAQMLFSQELILTSEVPTLAVDGTFLYINQEFFLSLTPELRESALVHEILHVVYEHMFRREWRDAGIWQLAIDFEVNAMVKEFGRGIGEHWLYDHKYKGMPAEAIYKDLLKELEEHPEKRPGAGEDGMEAFDNVMDPEGDATEVAQQRAVVQSSIIKAAQIAKQFGPLPGDIDTIIEEKRAAKQPWHEILHRWMKSMSWRDYTWNKPDRRTFAKTGLYAPRMFSERLGRVAAGVDWSGSMSDEQLAVINYHVNLILMDADPEKLHLMHFDTRIAKEEVVESHDYPVKFHTSARGGTDFRPVFQRIEELGEKPEVLLMFTDTMGAFPDEAPDYPVLWVTDYKAAQVPFGELIFID